MEKNLEFLDLAEKELNALEKTIISEVGGFYQYDIALIHQLKSSCYCVRGQLANQRNSKTVQSLFQKAIEEGEKALGKYNTLSGDRQLNLAELYTVLGISKAFLNSIEEKSCDSAQKEIDEAREILEKMIDPHKSRRICETWINISYFYGIMKNQNEKYYSLAQAESNKHWEYCAKSYGIPTTQLTFRQIPNGLFEGREFTMREMYDLKKSLPEDHFFGGTDEDPELQLLLSFLMK